MRVRELRIPAAGAALLAALLAGAPVAQACDVKQLAGAHRDPSRAVRAPLIVGDSTMLLATPYLGARGIEADARGCRQLGKGVDLLASRKRARTLPKVAVLALGSNGAIDGGQIRRALRLIGSGRVLGLVTPARAGSGSDAAMRHAARRYPDRVVLIDWRRYSHARGGIFAGDGLHVSDRGARVFARFVRRRLEPFFPPRGGLVPRTAAGAKPCGRLRRVDAFVVRGAARLVCSRARELVRARALAGIAGWRYYDWRRSGRSPWTAVYVRRDRKFVVVTQAVSAAAPSTSP